MIMSLGNKQLDKGLTVDVDVLFSFLTHYRVRLRPCLASQWILEVPNEISPRRTTHPSADEGVVGTDEEISPQIAIFYVS